MLKKSTTACCVEILIHNSTNFFKDRFVVSCLCSNVVVFMPIHHWIFPLLVLLLLRIICQAVYVNGKPSGSWSEIDSRRPLWKNQSSSAVNLLTDRTLWISLCSTSQITVNAYLRHPEFRNNSILFLGNRRGLKIWLMYGKELRDHRLLHGHGLNATSVIYVNSVPFLSV